MSQPLKDFYQFGPFRLDVVERQMWRDGEEISLAPNRFGFLYDNRFLSQFDRVRGNPRFVRLLRDMNLMP